MAVSEFKGAETDFSYAIQLAAAFVANGDLRLQAGLPHSELRDLIGSLYTTVVAARQQVAAQPIDHLG